MEAKKLLGQVSGGIDPSAVKADCRAKVLTLGKAFEAFLSGRKLKASTRADYEKRFAVYFGDWTGRQVASISPAMVSKRFATLTDNNGPGAANLAFRILRAVINSTRIATKRPDGTFALPENPVNRLSEAKAWNKLARWQTYVGEDSLRTWFAAIRDLQGEAGGVGDNYELLLRTGLRRNEAAGLHWDNVSLKFNSSGRQCAFQPVGQQCKKAIESRQWRPKPLWVLPGHVLKRVFRTPRYLTGETKIEA